MACKVILWNVLVFFFSQTVFICPGVFAASTPLTSDNGHLQPAISVADAQQKTNTEPAVVVPPTQDPEKPLSLPSPNAVIEKYNPNAIKVTPFSIHMDLAPELDSNRYLSVTVDQNGNATVIWTPNDNGKTEQCSGKFDPKTHQILIQDPTNVIGSVRLSFQELAHTGKYLLNSLEVVYKGGTVSTDDNGMSYGVLPHTETYTFNSDGLIQTRKSHMALGNDTWDDQTSYQYVRAGGKMKVASVTSYQDVVENGKSEHFASKDFFHYDAHGQQVAEVWAYSYIDSNGQWKCRAGYETVVSANTRIRVSADGLPVGFLDRVTSWSSSVIIDPVAKLRSTDYKRLPNGSYEYTVEEVKNAKGVFQPKMTLQFNADGSIKMTWIVQGKADILSGEHNDIPVKPSQNVNGYNVSYGSVNNQYGLIFEKYVPTVQVVVNYPAQKQVTLDGKIYNVQIDAQGIVTLT
jgi:hypothetical protein